MCERSTATWDQSTSKRGRQHEAGGKATAERRLETYSGSGDNIVEGELSSEDRSDEGEEGREGGMKRVGKPTSWSARDPRAPGSVLRLA